MIYAFGSLLCKLLLFVYQVFGPCGHWIYAIEETAVNVFENNYVKDLLENIASLYRFASILPILTMHIITVTGDSRTDYFQLVIKKIFLRSVNNIILVDDYITITKDVQKKNPTCYEYYCIL